MPRVREWGHDAFSSGCAALQLVDYVLLFTMIRVMAQLNGSAGPPVEVIVERILKTFRM